jgi:hypothetical protein
MTRDELLIRAAELVSGDRQAQYGDAEVMAKRIAKRWGHYVGELSPMGVMVMMAEMKMARIENDPSHADSWVDVLGYLALAGEMALSGRATAPDPAAQSSDEQFPGAAYYQPPSE